ncbi:PAS domain S-box protein [Halorientalis halophila]|uniref:PAS domain S-box protein n=1 Tax=Halorientalis halophila TaxID=3108499 RepID=UPI00300B32F7
MNAGRVVLYVGADEERAASLRGESDDATVVERVATVAEATERLDDVVSVVSEATLADGTGLDLCRTIRTRYDDVAFVLVPETGSDEGARRAVSAGVDEYVPAGTIDGPADLWSVVLDAIERACDEQRRYRKLVEQTTDAIAIVDPDTTIRYVSPGIEEILGYPPAELVGRRGTEIVHPEYREQVLERLAASLADPEESIGLVYRAEHADGGYRWLETRGRSYLDDPAIAGTVVSIRDVTERRERKRELELYENMLNTVPDCVYAVDEDGNFLAANETALETVGAPESDVIGSHASICMTEHDIERGRDLIRDLLESDAEKAIYEMDLHPIEGEPIPAENHVALLTDEDGRFRGSVGVLRDVSDRLERERRLTVLNRALRHDLRNSMHVVMANAELIRHSVSDPAAQAKLDTIVERAEQIDSLSEKAREIEQTLGHRERTRRSIDLAALLSDQIERFRTAHPEATVEADLPDHAWVAATGLIDTAVENLIENSIQHTDEPRVRVSLAVEDDTVTVSVADDGPGIPEKERRVVGKGSETPLDHASGLGLWLVTWITRDSGGEVAFETSEDGGSLVRIRLDRANPRVDGDGGPASADEASE